MSGNPTGGESHDGKTPTPNEGPAPGSSGGQGQARAARPWGAPSQPEDWMKVRSLVGKTFSLVRVTKATITPGSGANAGKARPSYVFELADGHLFSVNETGDSIGNQVSGFGIPPPGVYHIESIPSDKSTTGDALLLRPGPAPTAPTAPAASAPAKTQWKLPTA